MIPASCSSESGLADAHHTRGLEFSKLSKNITRARMDLTARARMDLTTRRSRHSSCSRRIAREQPRSDPSATHPRQKTTGSRLRHSTSIAESNRYCRSAYSRTSSATACEAHVCDGVRSKRVVPTADDKCEKAVERSACSACSANSVSAVEVAGREPPPPLRRSRIVRSSRL